MAVIGVMTIVFIDSVREIDSIFLKWLAPLLFEHFSKKIRTKSPLISLNTKHKLNTF